MHLIEVEQFYWVIFMARTFHKITITVPHQQMFMCPVNIQILYTMDQILLFLVYLKHVANMTWYYTPEIKIP